MHQTATLAHDGGFFGPAVMTGAHAASVIAVAEGRAEVAAIDAVTWRLCLRVEPKAQALRVLCWSDPAPGLPYITGRRAQAGRLAAAVTHGIAALDPALRETIGLAGFVATRPEDYDLIRDRLAAAQRLHSLPTAIA
jgi:ABC-type phosphate/phosphonate transport system substrate-binding protein